MCVYDYQQLKDILTINYLTKSRPNVSDSQYGRCICQGIINNYNDGHLWYSLNKKLIT